MGEPKNTVEAFISELDRKIEYFRQEFDLTYAEAVGCLELVKHRLIREVFDADEPDDEPEERWS